MKLRPPVLSRLGGPDQTLSLVGSGSVVSADSTSPDQTHGLLGFPTNPRTLSGCI